MLLSEGTENEVLSVVAGHRNYVFGSMFNRLDEVEVGDMIKVELMGKVFSYTATKIIIVEPDDLTVTEQNIEKNELTLVTIMTKALG